MHKTRLANLLNARHPMVRLAREIDWQSFDEHFGAYYNSGGKGRPAISTRLMVSLHYLKYTHDLSDEAVVRGWVENPYWQYLSGMEFFCHEPPIDPSSMSRWRSRGGGRGQRCPQRGGHELLQAFGGPRSFAVDLANSARGALCPSFASWNHRSDCRVAFFRIDYLQPPALPATACCSQCWVRKARGWAGTPCPSGVA